MNKLLKERKKFRRIDLKITPWRRLMIYAVHHEQTNWLNNYWEWNNLQFTKAFEESIQRLQPLGARTKPTI